MAKRPFPLERKVEDVARHPNDYTVTECLILANGGIDIVQIIAH